jgi:hypothetical protein
MVVPKYYCATCGSDQVHYCAWHHYNSDDVNDFYVPDNSVDYCSNCDDTVKLTDSPPEDKTPKGSGGSS